MTDYTAKGIQILSFIGDADVLDITANVDGISPVRTNSIDLAGYFKTECSLRLVSTNPEFLETRFNPRWAIANKIQLWITNSLGSLVLHRTFRILDAFFSEGRQDSERQISTLELELGDIFALKDARYPNPGDIDIPILENSPDVNVLTTVNYWLQVFDLPQITILPGDEAPQERIVTTGLYSANSSVLEHIGQILYANARFALWVDSQERVRIRRVGFPPDTTNYSWESNAQRIAYYKNFFDTLNFSLPNEAIAVNLLPSECLIYERSESEREKVAGLVQVVGVSNFRFPYVDPPPTRTKSSEGGVSIIETFEVVTSPLSRTSTKSGNATISGLQDGSDDPGLVGDYEEVTVENYAGEIPEIPNGNPVLPPTPKLPAYLQSTNYTLREQRPEGSSPNLAPIQVTKTIETTYTYRNTDAIVQGIKVRGREISAVLEIQKVLPTEAPFTLRVEQITRRSWTKLSEQIYSYDESIVRPADLENRRYSKNSRSIGQSTPPATQFVPQSQVNLFKEIYAQAFFNYPPDMPDNDHPRIYQLGAYLDNNKAAKLLAEHLGGLLIGRNEAQVIAYRPTDEWLADPVPAVWVAIARSPSEQDLYLLDIPVLTLDTRRTYLGGTGLFMGRRNLSTGSVTAPYSLGYEVWAYDLETLVHDDTGDIVRVQ